MLDVMSALQFWSDNKYFDKNRNLFSHSQRGLLYLLLENRRTPIFIRKIKGYYW